MKIYDIDSMPDRLKLRVKAALWDIHKGKLGVLSKYMVFSDEKLNKDIDKWFKDNGFEILDEFDVKW